MKISVVTASFNQGQFIKRTLESVSSQTGAEVEHVVFDGGSTDNTITILKEFTPKVRWVSEKDKGQADAINKGFRATSGEILNWLNSDDIFYPGALACVSDFFKVNPDVDVVYGMADHIDVNDNAFEQYPTEPWNFERLKETCFICQPSLFFHRRVIDRLGFLDESLNYCMDYEYWLRLGSNGVRFAYIKEKLSGSRLYADNKTLGSRIKVHHEINDMFKSRFGKVPDKWLFNYAHVVMEPRPGFKERNVSILLEIGVRSLLAALKWNRTISAGMLNCLVQWGKAAFSSHKILRWK